MSLRQKRTSALGTTRLLGAAARDLFNRADSATSMGIADSGQTWAPAAGNTFGLSSSKAYPVTTASPAVTMVDSGLSDVDLSCDVTTNFDNGIIFRAATSGTNNFYMVRFGTSGTALQFYKCVNGVFTALTSAAFTSTSGSTYTLRVVAKGTSFSVYVNGTLIINAFADSTYSTGTFVGLYGSVTTGSPRWDNFFCFPVA